MRLRHLTLIEQDMTLSSRVGAMDGGNADEVLSLPALAGLQALTLRDCKLWRLPRAVSALTALTFIDLCRNDILDLAPLAALQRLQSLNLSFCSLKAVPQQVSALTALTRLVLSTNLGMAGGL
jgi:Leucine-rich repeat (LRR) protein